MRSCPARDASDDLVWSPSGVLVARRTLRNLGDPLPEWAADDAAVLGRYLPPRFVAVALAWIEHESGGDLSSYGLASLDERGLFQISADESEKWVGLTAAEHEALSTDRDLSLEAGARLMDAYADDLMEREGIAPGAPSLPILAKLMHGGGPRYTRDLLDVADRAGASRSSWTSLLRTWKSLASDDNRLAGYCLIHVDSADAIRLRARSFAAVVRPAVARGRPFVSIAGGAVGLLALAVGMRVYSEA